MRNQRSAADLDIGRSVVPGPIVPIRLVQSAGLFGVVSVGTERILIGITTDVSESGGRVKLDVGEAYARCISKAGAVPVLLAPLTDRIEDYLTLCNGFVFTGGGDPRMEPFGGITHPSATPLHPMRQEFETVLLNRLDSKRSTPVLGVCLGMQMMCLNAGGTLDQHLPDTLPSHATHWGAEHGIAALAGVSFLSSRGMVASKHRQAMKSCGSLTPAAISEDGVIEAAWDSARRFYVGVQWHPERTADPVLGQALFDSLVKAARS